MRQRTSRVIQATLLLMMTTQVGVGATPPACDRACLKGFMTAYLNAVVAHDPGKLPMTRNIRFTENGIAVPVGKALWLTASGRGTFRSDYVDTESQQIAATVAIEEHGRPGLAAVRLKVEDGKQVSEIETILWRNDKRAALMPPPDPLWEEIEPPASRLTRQQLIDGVKGYLKANSSQSEPHPSRYVKFNPKSCIRWEATTIRALDPGVTIAGYVPPPPDPDPQSWNALVEKVLRIGCAQQQDTGFYAFISSAPNARFPVVDVERQVVWGVWNFRRDGVKTGIDYEGKYYDFGVNSSTPNENLLGQAAKFRDGGITRTQGAFHFNNYCQGTGWGPQQGCEEKR
jgi:hypothetical protein